MASGLAAAGVFAAAVSAGTPPSVTGTKQLVDAPDALACAGTVDVEVELTGTTGVEGTATDIVLVFDLSGSVASPALATAKAEAAQFVQALDAQDGGPAGQLGLGNQVGIVKYRTLAARVPQTTPIQDVTALTGALTGLSSTGTGADGSRHDRGIGEAGSMLGPGPKARTMVVFSDGQDGTDGSAAAAAAKAAGITVVTVGIDDFDTAELDDWATDKASNPLPLSAATDSALLAIVGAARSVPAVFTVTETLGAAFAASDASVTKGSVTGTGPLVWTGQLGNETATLTYRAMRDGSDPGVVSEEVVSTTAVTVTGGTGSVSPATVKILVLPCDGEELLDRETCSGASCTAGGTQGGVQYSMNAGTAPAGTQLFLTGLASPPPAGACPGFDANTNGVQFDIRPLTTPGTFEVVIPNKPHWWATDVCVATNMRFITKIGSFANLRPGATSFDGRWWGLLPSIRRVVSIPGLGRVVGPWINSRRPGPGGSAVVTFTMPFVAGSEGYTTNGLPAYDPRAWGG